MRSYKTEAIIIKRRNVGEADRIITIFTKDHGKIHIKATGIRKIPSRRSAHVELLNHALLTLYQGRKFPILTEAQMLESFSQIKDDLQKVGFAYHVCELIDGLCPENQENKQVFFLLKETMKRLCHPERSEGSLEPDRKRFFASAQNDKVSENHYNSGVSVVSIIHEFEIELLTLLGYWNKNSQLSARLDTHHFIETILERRLRTKRIFTKFS